MIRTNITKGIKKSLGKWGEIPIRTDYAEGVIKITNYRKYMLWEEVDATFKGKIFVRIYRGRDWHDSSVTKTHNISKVKLNRFLRKTILFDIQTRMNYFGVDIRDYYNIGKIKWE